jgi:molybdate transport system substrate-binding protein
MRCAKPEVSLYRMHRRSVLSGMVALTASATAMHRYAQAQLKDIVVFAAASLKEVLDEVGERFRRDTGKGVTVSYAASSTLAKQIENGAPADLFISADLDWMDYLEQRKLIRPWSRSELLGNKLVLIAPAVDGKVRLAIAPGFPLRTALGDGRLAMADPASVPAGLYGKAALENLGVWHAVASRLAVVENVRAALLLVARSETSLGIVYATDAAIDPGVRVIGTLPRETHPPIIYPVALTATSDNPDAAALLVYLRCAVASAIFQKAGFKVLEKAP